MSEQAIAQAKPQSIAAPSSSSHGILQRCSNGVECEECRKKRAGTLQRAAVNTHYTSHSEIKSSTEGHFEHDFSKVQVHHHAPLGPQAKLTIGQPGDQYEREADHVADTVMRMPDAGAISESISSTPRREVRRQQESKGQQGKKPATGSPVSPAVTTPTHKQIQQDDYLRSLAARPDFAFYRWKRLKPAEQTTIVTYMAMFYGLDFAKRFRAATLDPSRRDVPTIVTNDPDYTPVRLTASGYKLYKSDPIQIWVHPSGKEIWLIPPSKETPQQPAKEEQEAEQGQSPRLPGHFSLGLGQLQAPSGIEMLAPSALDVPPPGSMQLPMPEFQPEQQTKGLGLPQLHLQGEEETPLQRKEGNATSSASHEHSAPPIVHDVLRSPGRSLDRATRSFMESRFGHDFSGVRIHTDEQATESARSVHALAYTVGHDIVFGAGQYVPGSMAGKRLLAHELTHVVQQEANQRSSGMTIQCFEAGEEGHGGIEEEALIGKATGLPEKLQFSADEEKGIYIGNWLRDLSQVGAFGLVNILALGEFGREISKDELGTYIPSEHLDNPEGGGTIEDPKLTKKQRDTKLNELIKKGEISPSQVKAYKDEEAHIQDIQSAARVSGLPEYIERGKYHAKQQLIKAIEYGRTPEGRKAMGDGLHAIEDYYSHSNFVEICFWYLHNKGQIPDEQYKKLVKTEASPDAALLGNMSVPQGGPQIITGTVAPGANAMVSKLELIVSEVEHGELTITFIKGACRKLGITAKDILKKAAESGKSIGRAALGAVGGVIGGAIGAVGGAFKGAGEGAARGWREHSGLSALWHGFTGLFTGAASGAASGAKKGWNIGKSVGGAVGGAIGEVIGGTVGLTIDAVVILVGVPAILSLFPAILALRVAALAPVEIFIREIAAKHETRKAAKQAASAGLGPSHAELAKDNPHHHLYKIARALAVHVDRDIGNAMATAWEETRLRNVSAKSTQPPSAAVENSVKGLVDKYVSHPATDLWWVKVVKDNL